MTVSGTKNKAAAISRLALLAVGNKEAALLWMMVDRFMATDFIIGVAASADIAILDGEADGFAKALATWQADRPNAPAVVFRSAPVQPVPGVFNVAKPLVARELAEVLGRLRAGTAGTGSAAAGPAQAAMPSDESPRRAGPPSIPAPLPRFVQRTQAVGTDLLSVDICMSLDACEVLDSIGITSDISGNVGMRRPPVTARAPLRASA